MPQLIDVHTHVQFSSFDKDRDEVIKRALDKNIWMINVGADKGSSQKAIELARQYPTGIWATVGLHPHYVDEGFDYGFYKNLAQDSKLVAVGECGLDYYRNGKLEIRDEDKIKQKEIFIKHIELATELNKPLMIHCRAAFDDLTAILKSYSSNIKSPTIIHFFTGTLRDAKKLLEMNCYFTFGGLVTYNRSFDEIIKYLPLEKILLETDAPYVAPEPYRGKRNEPTYVIEVAKKLAEIKNLPYEKITEQTTANAIDILKIPI